MEPPIKNKYDSQDQINYAIKTAKINLQQCIEELKFASVEVDQWRLLRWLKRKQELAVSYSFWHAYGLLVQYLTDDTNDL